MSKRSIFVKDQPGVLSDTGLMLAEQAGIDPDYLTMQTKSLEQYQSELGAAKGKARYDYVTKQRKAAISAMTHAHRKHTVKNFQEKNQDDSPKSPSRRKESIIAN